VESNNNGSENTHLVIFFLLRSRERCGKKQRLYNSCIRYHSSLSGSRIEEKSASLGYELSSGVDWTTERQQAGMESRTS